MTRPLQSFLAAAALAAVASANAASVTVTFDNPIFNGTPGTPKSDVVSITFPKIGGGTQTASVHAGRFQGTATNLVGVSPSIFVDGVNDLFMYCYDVYEHIRAGQVVNYTINFDGETTRTLDFLGAVNQVLNTARATNDRYAWLHPASGHEAAAIQIGIWESRYEASGWDLAAGTFRAGQLDAATSTALTGFFAAIGSSPSLDGQYVMTLAARGAQDMITGDPPADVPLPGSLALLGAAVLAGGAARRGRR